MCSGLLILGRKTSWCRNSCSERNTRKVSSQHFEAPSRAAFQRRTKLISLWMIHIQQKLSRRISHDCVCSFYKNYKGDDNIWGCPFSCTEMNILRNLFLIFGGKFKFFIKAMHNRIVPWKRTHFPYIQAGQAGGFGDV